MKYIITILGIIFFYLYALSCNAYTLSINNNTGENVSWPAGEINIYLDPSLEDISDNAYSIIEESFLEYLDYIERDITINFIYKECSPREENCIIYDYQPTNNKFAYASWFFKWSTITNCSIHYSTLTDWNDTLLHQVSLHEVGHFFGLSHSEKSTAIMYATINTQEPHLTIDDINGIIFLYGGDLLPEPEIIISEEKEEKHSGPYAPCCSINNNTNYIKSIFSLLF